LASFPAILQSWIAFRRIAWQAFRARGENAAVMAIPIWETHPEVVARRFVFQGFCVNNQLYI